jgi:outer membrane protein assembly factor BamE (lipoprotein component of BamABCDE complex)
MHRRHAVVLLAMLAASATASAETLLVDRVHQENAAAMPTRGMTMAQVEARFGAPSEKLDPRGGQKHQWPTINRWTYPAFTVYFEKNHVVDAVANKADADEIGPKPAVK